MPAPFQLGQIVWASIADARGFRKLRPGIIATPTERIHSTGPLDVVAVTSRLPDPLPPDHVLLPWHPRRHPRTGLKRKCAAVCTWVVRISPTDIEDVAGILPGAVMLDILTKLANVTPPAKTSGSPAMAEIKGVLGYGRKKEEGAS
ncbi:MAG: type II toxin-antitoxin system PemK/MazF family toxin [bacterium]|nr:type II toxin-antitoxin system PemK/MazF family toxin [bacterium]